MTGILLSSVGNSYGSLPINTDAPAVSGTVSVGNSLSCSTGTWTGAPAPTFTYQWQRVSSNISGATSSSYTIVAADGGYTLRCVVTATNALGVVSANSANTIAVPIARAMGSATTVTGYKTRNLQIVYDSTNERVVATYIDGNNSSYSTARVGTVSSGSISWGTPVVFHSAAAAYGIAEGRKGTVYNSTSGKLVILFNVSSTIKSIVGTVGSGTSITFGSAGTAISSVPFEAQNATMISTTSSAKVVMYWMDPSNYNIKSSVGTISGTSVSWGTVSTAHDNTTADNIYMAAIWDSSQSKTVISYWHRGGSYNGQARVRVGTISGTTISHGSSQSTGTGSYIRPEGLAYSEASGKFLLATNKGKCTVGDLGSGGSITFGSQYTFDTTGTANVGDVRATYNSATEGFIIAFKDVSDSYDGKVVDVSVSGTACSFTSMLDFYGDASDDLKYHQITFDGDTRQAILSLEDEAGSPSYRGFTVVYTPAYP